jgi:hypothetical protein
MSASTLPFLLAFLAQDPPPGGDLPQKVEALEKENRDLLQRVERLERNRPASLDQELQELGAPGTAAPRSAQDQEPSLLAAPGLDFSKLGLSQSFGGIYTKPFLTESHGVALGGYASWRFEDAEGDHHSLEFPRLVPFFYAQPSANVRFASEIEIEDGHELEMEFAFVDFLVADSFNVRGGLLLDPLGRFNLVHDDPVNELTDRPLVSQTVIPTTLRELGAGAFGTLASADSPIGQVTYEVYLTSGFRGLLDDGTTGFDTDEGLHDGKADEEIGGVEAFEDNNNDFAEVGRLEWSPVLGATFGASAHHGDYDESGDNSLLVLALDGALDGKAAARWFGTEGAVARAIGGFELLGEWARADIERDAFARASGIPGDMNGWYVQVNYRLYPEFLKTLERNGSLGAGSHFTCVVRRDDIDLDGFGRERWTLGVNFRPNQAQTVVKLDYQINRERGLTPRVDDDAILVSIATYF